MTINELITALRDNETLSGTWFEKVANEAADRLEELDERVAIMSESKTGKWERHYSRPNVYADLSWWCSNCGEKCLDNWANKYQYCPHCGARMEETEREEKADHA